MSLSNLCRRPSHVQARARLDIDIDKHVDNRRSRSVTRWPRAGAGRPFTGPSSALHDEKRATPRYRGVARFRVSSCAAAARFLPVALPVPSPQNSPRRGPRSPPGGPRRTNGLSVAASTQTTAALLPPVPCPIHVPTTALHRPTAPPLPLDYSDQPRSFPSSDQNPRHPHHAEPEGSSVTTCPGVRQSSFG